MLLLRLYLYVLFYIVKFYDNFYQLYIFSISGTLIYQVCMIAYLLVFKYVRSVNNDV